MVQHIRKKHPELAQLGSGMQAPLTAAVISSAPAVISADGATAEAVVVRNQHLMFFKLVQKKLLFMVSYQLFLIVIPKSWSGFLEIWNQAQQMGSEGLW